MKSLNRTDGTLRLSKTWDGRTLLRGIRLPATGKTKRPRMLASTRSLRLPSMLELGMCDRTYLRCPSQTGSSSMRGRARETVANVKQMAA